MGGAMSRLRDELGLFADRTFAFFFAGRAVSTLGSSFTPVALAFSVLHLPHGSPELLSIVLACEAIPMVAFMLVGGVVADRFPRARVLRVGELLSGAAFGAIGVMILLGWTPTPALGVAAALSGTGIALLYPALTGLVPEVVPADRLQAGNALLGLARNIALVFGLVGSGIVVAGVGGAWALLIGAAMFVVAAGLSLPLPLGAAHPEGLSVRSAFSDLVVGWKEFTAHEWLWVVVAEFSLLVMFYSAAYGVIGPVLADAELGGARPWSWILAAEAAGNVLGGVIGLKWKPEHPIRAAVIVTALGLPGVFIAMGLGAPLVADLVLMTVAGVGFGLFGVFWNTAMQVCVDPESLSKVASYDALGSLIFQPLGLLIGGPAVVVLGARTAMMVCGIALVVVCVTPLLSRDVRQMRLPVRDAGGASSLVEA